jgi:hypothetical protein
MCTRLLAAQATVLPDRLRTPPAFEREKVTLTLYLERQGVAIHSELDRDGRATGHFAVFSIWPLATRFLAAYTDWAYDQPSVALVADGRPGVVLLASYTGGLGRDRIPNYSFKLLVLHDGGAAEAFSVVPSEFPGFPSSDVTAFSRSASEGFTLAIKGGPKLVYSHGRLVVH